MLKGIDPFLGPDLLCWLAQMGHGDVIAVVDRNFPAYGGGPRVWESPQATADSAIAAVLSVFPLDQYDDAPLRHMLVDDGTDGPALADVQAVAEAAEGRTVGVAGVDRMDFYPLAARAFATIRTGETRPYACFLLAKGCL